MLDSDPTTWPVEFSGGFYRYVNHDLKETTWGEDTLNRNLLASPANVLTREARRQKYQEIYPNKEPKMKPFNLEAAKAGKPIVTRDGRVAKFVAHEPDAIVPVIAVLISGRMHLANADGTFPNPAFNIFMAEEEITVYFNEYTNGEFGQVETDKDELVCGRGVAKVHEVKIKV